MKQEKEKAIKIDDYYYKVIKDIDEGILIDNNETKAAYNKPYEATISVSNGDVITTLKVTMGEKEITTSEGYIVDIKTGKIKIEKVTDDIKIIAHISDNKLIFKFDGTSEDSYGHVTTESGKITYSDDAIEGKSAYFNGNSFIKIKVDEEDRLGDNFIIDWWEKPENNGTRFYSFYQGQRDTGLLVNYYGKLYASENMSYWNSFLETEAFCKNEFNVWTHWQLVRDGNTWTTYKNDKKYWQGNKSGTIRFDKNAYYTIGRYRDGDESYYKGYIDEFKIYINKDN